MSWFEELQTVDLSDSRLDENWSLVFRERLKEIRAEAEVCCEQHRDNLLH